MGDPRVPWQEYGSDARSGGRAPGPDEPTPAPGYPVPWRNPGGLARRDELGPVPGQSGYSAYSEYSDEGDDWGYDEDEDDGPDEGPVRRAAGELAWRYRSAPLALRVGADVTAAVLVLAVVVGGALALRHTSPSDEVGAFVAPTSTTVPPAGSPTTEPVPLGTTTTATEPPPPSTTTTTTRPTTTTAPTTTAPPETTTTTNRRGGGPPGEVPHYDNCFQAFRAGALPLYRGDPGYGPHLDDDDDGRACEWGEGT